MADDTTPFFGKGGRSASKKRRTRGNRSTKGGKEYKTSRRNLSYRELDRHVHDGMVQKLCRVVYDHRENDRYHSRTAFCQEFGELVVDRQRVPNAADRAKIVDRLLGVALEKNMIEIYGANRSRVMVRLSDAEHDRQQKLEQERDRQRNERWKQRRTRKAA